MGSQVARPAMTVMLVFCLTALVVQACSIKLDEEVVFFPTSARLDTDAKTWVVPVRGWIFEREEDSVWRTAVVDQLLAALELESHASNNALFRQRARWFLVDNEGDKAIEVMINGQVFPMHRSGSNGHFTGLARLNTKSTVKETGNPWLSVAAVMPKNDKRIFKGVVQLVAPEGLSVVSDIDDTIKHSNVRDKKALLANTFLNEFEAVAGMPEVYREWAADGAVFHYVSASPWQLYPSLSAFINHEGFPPGSFHMRLFRIKDQTFLGFLASSEPYKTSTIESILRTYPQRRFILVGDSGEKDPEVYAELARRFPEQVTHIFIRDVSEADEDKRFASVFKGLPKDRWTVFRHPREMLPAHSGATR